MKFFTLFICLALLLSSSAARSLNSDGSRHHSHHHHHDHHHQELHDHGHGHNHGHSHRNFPALYAIGDSSIDTGNNNNLPTPYKANHIPYGKDFPGGSPTGRFSNGKLIVDFLSSVLGLKENLPAYGDERTSDSDLQTGVSLGHSGAGLIDSTSEMKHIPTMDQQMDNFDRAVQTMVQSVGEERAGQIVKDALYLISVGTNDLVDGYYSLESKRSFQISIEAYHNAMLQRLEHLLVERLYQKGARKMIVIGLPPIGCLPTQVATQSIENIFRSVFHAQRLCIEPENVDTEGYNTKLQDLISRLNSQYSDNHIEYADIYNPMADMLRNPNQYGLVRLTEGCCGSGYVEMCNYCNPITPTCPSPDRTVFWDAQNPTQAVNAFLAQTIEHTVVPKLQS